MSPIVPGSSDTSNDQLVSHEDLVRRLVEARATKDLHKERQQELIAELEQLRRAILDLAQQWEQERFPGGLRNPQRIADAERLRSLVEGDAIV